MGASGQLGKEQALPCAENLFSRCGVRLGEYDGTPHGGTCPSSAELPEFLQRQECGTTETVSEAPGHINCLELWAVHLALRQFRPLLLCKHVLVRTDNTRCLVNQPAGRYTITPHVTALGGRLERSTTGSGRDHHSG